MPSVVIDFVTARGNRIYNIAMCAGKGTLHKAPVKSELGIF